MNTNSPLTAEASAAAPSFVLRALALVSAAVVSSALAACGDADETTPDAGSMGVFAPERAGTTGIASLDPWGPVFVERVQRLEDPSLTLAEREDAILALGEAEGMLSLAVLLRMMKHRTQAAFWLVPDAEHELGWRAVEHEAPKIEEPPSKRVAAILALEKRGESWPLPDLALALSDPDPTVKAHAARALVRLGSRAGLPVLLELLRGRAYANETANRMLEEITGVDVGYHTDGGHAARMAAVDRWQEHVAGVERRGARYPLEGRAYVLGSDAETDRRLRFYVELLGQFQFLYQEQSRRALRRLGPIALPFLREAVEHSGQQETDLTMKAGVAQVLSVGQDTNSLALLKLLAGDAHPTIRSRSADSFGVRGGPEAVQALQVLGQDEDSGVVKAALEALGVAGGEEALGVLIAYAAPDSFPEDIRADLGEAAAIAAFRASAGRAGKERVFELLVRGRVGARLDAWRALKEVSGVEIAMPPEADEARRAEIRDEYAALLL